MGFPAFLWLLGIERPWTVLSHTWARCARLGGFEGGAQNLEHKLYRIVRMDHNNFIVCDS